MQFALFQNPVYLFLRAKIVYIFVWYVQLDACSESSKDHDITKKADYHTTDHLIIKEKSIHQRYEKRSWIFIHTMESVSLSVSSLEVST